MSHSANGALYTVDPKTGASAAIAGISVPSVDGIVLSGRRLWAVQNSNQITRILLNDDLTAGTVEKVITSDLFQVPSTAARFGNRLAVVNASSTQGSHQPPTNTRSCWSTDSFGRPIRGQRRLEERGRPQAGRDLNVFTCTSELSSKPSTATAASPRRLPAVVRSETSDDRSIQIRQSGHRRAQTPGRTGLDRLLGLDEESLAADLEPAGSNDLIVNALELLAVSGNVEARRLPRNRTQLEDDRPYVEEARDDGGLAHIMATNPARPRSSRRLATDDGVVGSAAAGIPRASFHSTSLRAPTCCERSLPSGDRTR